MRIFMKHVLIVIVFLYPAAVSAAGLPDGLRENGETGMSFKDLPEIPGSEWVEQRVVDPEHLIAEHYVALNPSVTHEEAGRLAAAEVQPLLERMASAGWTLIKESRQRRGGEFVFRKDIIKEVRASIGTKSLPRLGRMAPYITIRLEYSRRIPFADILGRDPADVPRYPGCIRVRWMNLLGDFAAKYLVVADVEEVKVFFLKELEKHDWRIAKSASDLNFTKGGVTAPGDMPKQAMPPDKPIDKIASMIPSTLSLAFADNDGIVEIGIGRSTGAPDRNRPRGELETATTPAAPELTDTPPPGDVTASIDIDRDIPVYEGLVRISREDLPVNHRGEDTVRLTCEIAEAPMEEALAVAEFYQDRMPASGWKAVGEEWFGIGRTLHFRRDAVGAKIAVKAVGRYPIPERAPRIRIPVEIDITFMLPRRETAGDDIEGVPRYPGSVRFYTLKAGIDHIVKFKTVARADAVERFFVENLPEAGWHFAGNDRTGLLFIPADTAESAAGALAEGRLVPTTLKIKVDHFGDPTVMIGMDLTKGD